MASIPKSIAEDFEKLRQASRALRALSSAKKNDVLKSIAAEVHRQSPAILAANVEDLRRLPSDTTPAFRDRLTLNPKRVEVMVESLSQVAALPDPVGEIVDEKQLPNGLKLKRLRAPLGVILMIFESRPNVILEAFSLAFKAGNAIALRGGSESKSTADVIYGIMRATLAQQKLSDHSFLGISDYDRQIVEALLRRNDWIDIVVPRGGDHLIQFVQKTAQMPIIKNDRGLCHTYVEDDANIDMAVRIVANAKTQRPGVCNSLETVLVNRTVAKEFLPKLYEAMNANQVTWHCDGESLEILRGMARVEPAKPEHWDTEYLDLVINCKLVRDLNEALAHIERHGSKHSEAIVTSSEARARKFQIEVDAAAVYWNASTRFTDGFEFGLGGELGISTQKLHVRGPVGLRELTTPRWIVIGNGQIRS